MCSDLGVIVCCENCRICRSRQLGISVSEELIMRLMVPPAGIEPATPGLGILCSIPWATRALIWWNYWILSLFILLFNLFRFWFFQPHCPHGPKTEGRVKIVRTIYKQTGTIATIKKPFLLAEVLIGRHKKTGPVQAPLQYDIWEKLIMPDSFSSFWQPRQHRLSPCQAAAW